MSGRAVVGRELVAIVDRYAERLGIPGKNRRWADYNIWVVDVRSDEQAWVELPLDDAWLIACRLGIQRRGRIAISELRLFPREPYMDRPLGRWKGDVLGYKAAFPQGGITTSTLRKIRLGECQRYAVSLMRRLADQSAEFFGPLPG